MTFFHHFPGSPLDGIAVAETSYSGELYHPNEFNAMTKLSDQLMQEIRRMQDSGVTDVAEELMEAVSAYITASNKGHASLHMTISYVCNRHSF